MSEQQAASEPTQQPSSPLRTVLFAILGLLLIALAYDFLWARKQQEAAAARIDSLIAPDEDDTMIASAEPNTIDDVHEALGIEPSHSDPRDKCLVERYSWRGGLPWKTHDLYVVYTSGDPRYFHDMSVGAPPEPSQLPQSVNTGPPPTTSAAESGSAPGSDVPEVGGADDHAAHADGETATEDDADSGDDPAPTAGDDDSEPAN